MRPKPTKPTLMEQALKLYCTPHGKASPETYAWIEGKKSQLKRVKRLENKVKMLEKEAGKKLDKSK